MLTGCISTNVTRKQHKAKIIFKMFAELEEVIAIIITFWERKYALHLTTTKKKKKN